MTYTVTKYAQSCFLIRKDGMCCLIDPGRFVYERDGMKPSDWPKVDVVLITHEHPDHADTEGIRLLVDRDACPVITNASFAAQLASNGIPAQVIRPSENKHVHGFHVRGVAQKHGVLSGGRPIPEDIGFVVDSTFYTPGDSVNNPDMPRVPVLFVPVAGPDMNFDTAREMIGIVKPALAIPMHYANTAKFPIDEKELRTFAVEGTKIQVLDDTESFDWPPAIA